MVKSKEIIKKAIYVTEIKTKTEGGQRKCENSLEGLGIGGWTQIPPPGFVVCNPGTSRK